MIKSDDRLDFIRPIKLLNIQVKYKDQEKVFTIYTDNINISLIELLHQSFLPSSSMPIKVYMGEEYVGEVISQGMIPGNLSNIREELRSKTRELSNEQAVIDQIDDAINTAIEWFGD